MRCLIDSIMHNYPIPSCIVNVEIVNGRERYSIYDGRHRMETLRRYINNEFKWMGSLFKDLSDDDKIKFLERTIPVTITSGASQQQLADVFVRLNAGVALKPSDYCWAYRSTPLIRAVLDLVHTNNALSAALGGIDISKRTMLANWTGLVLGLSRAVAGDITNSWIRISSFLNNRVDIARVSAGLDAITSLLTRANTLYPVASKKAGAYAKVGFVIAFFIHEWLAALDKESVFTKWLDIIRRLRSGPADAVGMKSALKTSGAQNLTLERIETVLEQVNNYLAHGVIAGDGDPDMDEEDADGDDDSM